jgi:hypothetical protein
MALYGPNVTQTLALALALGAHAPCAWPGANPNPNPNPNPNQVLHTALGDSSAAVARSALKAVGSWAMSILESSDDARLLKPMLPAMLQVCGRAVGQGDEETTKLGCGILDDCVECPAGEP